jgi:hypothetical protein
MNRKSIGDTLRDCKTPLYLSKLMNKQQHHLEQMIALSLIAYVLGFWFGEAIRVWSMVMSIITT